MGANSSRVRRIGDQIQRDLAKIIQQEVKDPRVGMVTVNDVKVSSDLSYADVYFTCMAFGRQDAVQERGEQEKILNNAAGFMRTKLAKGLNMRVIPLLRFHYDKVIDTGSELSALIDRAIDEDKSHQTNSDDLEG